MAYQTFDEEKGDSDSAKKLAAIKLPESLEGKSLLDMGCNAGFFCREALRRGATRVVGVDNNAKVLEDARTRVSGAEFLETDWWNLPAERFDFILFMSAIHYERNQKRLLQRLLTHLTPDGVLILECGVVRNTYERRWTLYERGDGSFVYPSLPLLLEELLDDYAVRDMGASVNQAGDPVPRFVFHCRRLKPMVILVGGAPGAGKTVLAREFTKLGGRAINLDFHYSELCARYPQPRSRALRYLRENFRPQEISEFLRKAQQDKAIGLLDSLVVPVVASERSLTIIEGFQFTLPAYLESMKKALAARGFEVRVLTL